MNKKVLSSAHRGNKRVKWISRKVRVLNLSVNLYSTFDRLLLNIKMM